MLDVYRKTYHFTGEPFRLGPDHRFSLHHSSYASAKAYLEYAIFQGEGFVTITGGPGTGKTTLISEILSVLDTNRVAVSRLTSTQLESRDLLHMVAHSFGIQADDVSKVNLLLEIELFLLKKVRSGRRAILIVDEAQGLSEGALEELRLLANLQHQHQLLLQIVLVGQDQLLELLRRPAMEHLQQRMVAATSLEPLDFDGTVDYVEHRLSRVGWKGDPGIEEGALRLVYRYSGGVPRRINLIMNRLFIYGGLDDKHQYVTGDAQEVINGLIEEFLLRPDPLIDEANVEKKRINGDAGTRPRYLPREPVGKQSPAKPADAARVEPELWGSADKAEPARQNAGGKSDRLSPGSTDARQRPASTSLADMDIGSARRNSPQRTGRAIEGDESTARGQLSGDRERESVLQGRRTDTAVGYEPKKKKGSKGLFLVFLLLVGAGSAYLLREESASLNQIYPLIAEIKEQYQSVVSAFVTKWESGWAPLGVDPLIEGREDFDGAKDAGQIDRQPLQPETPEDEVDSKVEDAPDRDDTQPDQVLAEPGPMAVEQTDALTSEQTGEVEKPAVPAEAPVQAGKSLADDIEAQRARLRRDAAQRFAERRDIVPVTTVVPDHQVSPSPVIETVPPE